MQFCLICTNTLGKGSPVMTYQKEERSHPCKKSLTCVLWGSLENSLVPQGVCTLTELCLGLCLSNWKRGRQRLFMRWNFNVSLLSNSCPSPM